MHFVPCLKAGISCWGLGEIAGRSTDEWLLNFINNNNTVTTLRGFAEELARQLNTLVTDQRVGEGIAGFHLAGFEDYNGAPAPSFYHIHDGISTVLRDRGLSIDTSQFNANHDMPPDIFIRNIGSGNWYLTRNGDYYMYANIFSSLQTFFNSLRPEGIIIPNSQNLRERAEYLIFQIRTMSEIYRLSNLVPGIGGGIHYLTISRDGLKSEGIEY
jgi:hypothetical protein